MDMIAGPVYRVDDPPQVEGFYCDIGMNLIFNVWRNDGSSVDCAPNSMIKKLCVSHRIPLLALYSVFRWSSSLQGVFLTQGYQDNPYYDQGSTQDLPEPHSFPQENGRKNSGGEDLCR